MDLTHGSAKTVDLPIQESALLSKLDPLSCISVGYCAYETLKAAAHIPLSRCVTPFFFPPLYMCLGMISLLGAPLILLPIVERCIAETMLRDSSAACLSDADCPSAWADASGLAVPGTQPLSHRLVKCVARVLCKQRHGHG